MSKSDKKNFQFQKNDKIWSDLFHTWLSLEKVQFLKICDGHLWLAHDQKKIQALDNPQINVL